MRISVKEITESVLCRLNEVSATYETGESIYGEPWMDLRDMIGRLIPEMAREVILRADFSELGEFNSLGGTPTVLARGEEKRMLLPLPSDYLRLVYIRMSDWLDTVTDVETRSRAELSYRRFLERRAGYESMGEPALRHTFFRGAKALEILGSAEGSTVAEGGYLPEPVIDPAGSLTFPPSLREALIESLTEKIKEIRG